MKTGKDVEEAIRVFCEAASRETGDFWEVQDMEDGEIAVVQVFRSAAETMSDPSVPQEEKDFLITGCIFCRAKGGLAELAEALLRAYSAGTSCPLRFLSGCRSFEEMYLRLTVCGFASGLTGRGGFSENPY